MLGLFQGIRLFVARICFGLLIARLRFGQGIGVRSLNPGTGPLTTGRAGSPALFASFTPELDGLFAAQLPAVLNQGNWFAWQQFAADDLQPLAVEIPANWPKPKNELAIAGPLRLHSDEGAGMVRPREPSRSDDSHAFCPTTR